ncbi:rhamnogalacturonan acetylesterase [Trichodelitschia bisporula]|uniref:Rhamnogalacturonan acetylesterase n=1 Tax=Trichodelitschia bisporula TaxID=703511 RepID=A0A6G1IAE3_9PEZI|nr:rhamnogalacturonan acetylesterase [Trichodelitschia bisporula]
MKLAIAVLAHAAAAAAATPKLLICSDSTTANYTSGPLQGWGYYIGEYLSIGVVNLARNGRSTRSFIKEGLWSKLLSQTQASDYVVIEMGHNDDGDPTDPKNTRGGRSVLPGIDGKTASVKDENGKAETVHTFGFYLREMIEDVRKKNAIPIISGMVPRNYWRQGKLQSDYKFTDWARQTAEQEKVEFLDHTKYGVERLRPLGETKAKTYFPQDNTHTNAAGAKLNAETFVTAAKCAKSQLVRHLNGKGQEVKQSC